MQIKKRLQINVVVSVLTAVVICLVLSLSLYRINEANNSARIAGEIITGVLERVTLRNDYLRNNSVRAKEQWFARHARIGGLLKSASENFRNAEDRSDIAGLIEIHGAVTKIFSAIVANREKVGLNPGSAELSREVEDRLLSQLNMRVYEEVLHERKLLESSRQAHDSALRLAVGGVVSALLILIAVAMINSRTMGRAITDRVARLREGASVIGGGDLDHRIDIKGDDEFAELAESFNAMTAKLSGSYSDLKNEVEERKRAEDALRESEERFRTMANAMPQLAWIARADGHIFWYNQRWYDYTGTKPEQMEGWGWQSVHDPNELPKVLERWQASIATGNPFDMTFPLRGTDGVFRPFLTRVIPLKDLAGRVMQWFGTNTDVYELKRIEDALRESEERFRNMFERHKAIMLLIEPESGAIVDANASAEDFYRRSREELCSLNIRDINLLPADEVDDQRHKAVHEEQDHFVFPHPLATGETRWVEVYSTPVLSHGTPLLFSIIHDITERREAEQERQLSMEFLGLVNESKNSADMIREAIVFFYEKSGCEAVGIRLKEGDDYPYFETHGFSEEFVLLENHLCDYSENGEVICDCQGNPVIECMCGNIIRSRFDPSKPFFTPLGSFWSNCTTELLASTTDADRQARTRNRCNGEGYESVALIPIGTAEERLGLLQLNDRSKGRFSAGSIALWERMAAYLAVALSKFQADDALREAHDELAQQVEERTRDLREKEVMLKEIHHRVKNNLQVISSLVSLQADGSKDETVREVLKDVTYRVRSMALVHEKLYQSADLARVDFAEYARSLLSYLWRAHGSAAAAVRLTLDLEPVSLPVDTAIPCGLILNELAGNALKHAFRGRSEGEVTVSLQNGADGSIRLAVADNGVGLPEGLDWRQAPSLGLRLVQLLSKQLDAGVEAGGENGTKFEITFWLKTEGA